MMNWKSRLSGIAVVVALIVTLSLPVAGAAGQAVTADGPSDGPVAHKAGAVVNYATQGKIKVARTVGVSFVCSVACSVTSTLTIKGPIPGSDTQTATDVPAGQLLTHYVNLNKNALGFVREHLRKFRVVSTVTATDATTGGVDTLAQTFRLKR
jgi:hypothetical protein